MGRKIQSVRSPKGLNLTPRSFKLKPASEGSRSLSLLQYVWLVPQMPCITFSKCISRNGNQLSLLWGWLSAQYSSHSQGACSVSENLKLHLVKSPSKVKRLAFGLGLVFLDQCQVACYVLVCFVFNCSAELWFWNYYHGRPRCFCALQKTAQMEKNLQCIKDCLFIKQGAI